MSKRGHSAHLRLLRPLSSNCLQYLASVGWSMSCVLTHTTEMKVLESIYPPSVIWSMSCGLTSTTDAKEVLESISLPSIIWSMSCVLTYTKDVKVLESMYMMKTCHLRIHNSKTTFLGGAGHERTRLISISE